MSAAAGGCLPPEALLALLQLADSGAPVGGYAHSAGLEGLAQAGALPDGRALRGALDGMMRQVLATADLVGVVQAHRAAATGDLARLLALDALFSAQKVAREARAASVGLGRRLLANAANLTDTPLVDAYRARVEEGRGQGHACVAFGLVAWACGVGEEPAALGFGYAWLAGALAAALRLGILGQSEAQVVLRERWPALAAAVARARARETEEIAAFAPALEIAMMRHERAYSRLFAS